MSVQQRVERIGVVERCAFAAVRFKELEEQMFGRAWLEGKEDAERRSDAEGYFGRRRTRYLLTSLPALNLCDVPT